MSTADSTDRIENDFNYHAPTGNKVGQHEQVRASFKTLAHFMNGQLPDGREKALVLTKLEEAMFWANAAIARNNPTA